MPRGQRKEIQYEGKALKIYEQVLQTEEKLKNLKSELKIAYKEQIAAKKKAEKESIEKNQKRIMDAIKKSGKSADEILSLLGTSMSDDTNGKEETDLCDEK